MQIKWRPVLERPNVARPIRYIDFFSMNQRILPIMIILFSFIIRAPQKQRPELLGVVIDQVDSRSRVSVHKAMSSRGRRVFRRF